MRKELNSQRILLVHQHGRCFIVLDMAAVTSCENALLSKYGRTASEFQHYDS